MPPSTKRRAKRRRGRREDRGRGAGSRRPGARRRDLGLRPRQLREAEPEAGERPQAESRSPKERSAQSLSPEARRGATSVAARTAPTWRPLRAAAPASHPRGSPHLPAAPPPAMSRTRAQRRPPAMTAARAGGGEAGAQGWRRGAWALPPPAPPRPRRLQGRSTAHLGPGPLCRQCAPREPAAPGPGPALLYWRVRYPGAEARPASSPPQVRPVPSPAT